MRKTFLSARYCRESRACLLVFNESQACCGKK